MNLPEKHRPNSFLEIKGQEFAVERLKYFIENFPGYKKAVILFGPAGTGKTTLAHVLAKETKSEIMEINSSNLRNREQLEMVVRPATEQLSLFNKSKIILVDEVDGISKVDMGGLDALMEIIKSSSFPIIMTANDIWDKKFAELRKISEIIPVKQLNYRTVFYFLKEIALKEKIQLEDEVILRVAIKSNGDIRAALNDLEIMNEEKDTALLSKNILLRDEKKDIFTILKEIFKNKFSNEILDIFDSTDMTLDEIFLWMEENIPSEYKGEELFKAYEALSLADVFRGRIIRRQHFRFLVYQTILLSAGISSAKERPKFGFTSYKKPSRILKIWLSNRKNAKRNSIIEKYCDKNHISIKKAVKDFPVLVNIFKNPEVQKELKFSEEESKYLEEYDKEEAVV